MGRRTTLWRAAAILALSLSACGGSGDTPVTGAGATPSLPNAADLAALGKLMFFDPSLSASGQLACATCHDPGHAYGPANALAAQMGGPTLATQGMRAVPSLRYVLNITPAWYVEVPDNGADAALATDYAPVGGFDRDGRVNSVAAQAVGPLLTSFEMANSNNAAVAAKLQATPYAAQFAQVFGAGIWQRPDQVVANMQSALAAFELNDSSFAPYSSKYDAYLQGKGQLTAQELNGLALFNDPAKGNCASCHISAPGYNNAPPLFTDFSFENLGVPRNPNIADNADPTFYDMGLCGPLRTDLSALTGYCGMFKTPSLRNVAGRLVFMHNGAFTDLAQVVRFYVQRDINPAAWYPLDANGNPITYNDLPAALRGNVDITDAPFVGQRSTNAQSALTEDEIQDVVAFLHTLTDADVPDVQASASP